MRFLETNIFLYVITAHPNFGSVAKAIFQRIEEGEAAATSSLVVAEVCAWLEYHKLDDKIGLLFKILQSYSTLTVIETTYNDEVKAKDLESHYPKLEFFDRVYLAQMNRLKIPEIYSNDKGFDKVKEIKRLFH
ncbi:MAG TPA: type II toxin-antitoxin system VapC family toxin [Candidatus Bathyarchaeia archaeon]|nr:type II toxin-antitoxin system VapC family toxin [Candidatus Bathyarchaeia archaeon]